jgi:hypothetical protein
MAWLNLFVRDNVIACWKCPSIAVLWFVRLAVGPVKISLGTLSFTQRPRTAFAITRRQEIHDLPRSPAASANPLAPDRRRPTTRYSSPRCQGFVFAQISMTPQRAYPTPPCGGWLIARGKPQLDDKLDMHRRLLTWPPSRLKVSS